MNGIPRALARFWIGIGVAIGVLAVSLPAPATAATCTWTGAGGDARWSNPANWTGCPVPVSGDAVVFPATGTPLSVNDIAGLSIGTMDIAGTPAISSYVITGLGVTLDFLATDTVVDANGNGPLLALPITMAPTMTGARLTVNVIGAPLTITGAITGAAPAVLDTISNNPLILGSPANDFDEWESFTGYLRLGVAGALPANITIRMTTDLAVLDLNNFDATIGDIQAPFPPPFNAPTIRLGSATLTIAGAGTFDGRIQGTGGIVKTGSGAVRFGSQFPNTYLGTTTVNGGLLHLAKAPNVTAIAGPIVVNGGTLLLGTSEQIADTAAVTLNSPGALIVGDLVRETMETIGSLAGNGNVTLGAATLSVGANGNSTTFAGNISGLYGGLGRVSLRKVGAGTLTLTGAHTYRGNTRIEAGTLLVNGSIGPGDYETVELFGGTLGGVGSLAQSIYAPAPNTTVSPGTSPGILHVIGAYLRGTYLVEINAPIAGSGYDQLDVTQETIDVTGATLDVRLGYNPPAGTAFTIIKLPAGPSHASIGTFAGIPEGTELFLRNQRFGITYHGGDGNDVVLTALENPPTLSIDDVTVTEGHASTTDAVFTASLSRTVNEPITVQYAIASGTAAAPADYTAQSGTLVFLPGTTTQTISVSVTGDREVEPDETFLVTLSGLSGAPVVQGIVTFARSQGTGTIATDDAARTYYLSEGSTGGFFDEDILLANPNASIAPVTLTFLKENGEQVLAQRSIAPWSHVTVHADLLPGLDAAAASVTVTSESGVPLMVERTMFWDAAYTAGHTGTAVDGAAQDWLFGEGSQGFFDTFVLVANPHDTATDVTFTFLLESGEPVIVSRTVAPTARLTLYAGEIPALVDRSFGVAVHATQPIMAERSMYFGRTPVSSWRGGTVSAGVTSTATHWYLAEGATGGFFDTFILLSNPQGTPANATVRYLLDSGETITVPKVVPANGRLTIDIEGEGDPRLHNAAVSTVVTSDVPIVAERSMYWASGTWREAHNSFGVVELGTRWALAEGRVGGALHFQTYVLLANPQADAAHVTVTYLREEGAPIVRQYTVPPTSRFNIDVNAVVPEMHDESFGTLIEVTNGIPIAVERSMYWDAQGLFWSGGTNATGSRLP